MQSRLYVLLYSPNASTGTPGARFFVACATRFRGRPGRSLIEYVKEFSRMTTDQQAIRWENCLLFTETARKRPRVDVATQALFDMPEE